MKSIPCRIRLAEQLQTPEVKAEANKQDFKSTVQEFKYTGKGSFIDHVF